MATLTQSNKAPKTSHKTGSLERNQQLWGWLFLSPWIIGFLAFSLIPIAVSLYFSFTDFNLVSGNAPAFNNFAHWKRMFTNDPTLKIALTATLKFAIIALPLSIALPVLLAALLNSEYLKLKPIYRTLFYMPYMVPVVSSVYIWGGMLSTDSGWINRFLALFGITGPDWMFSITWIYPALNIIGLWGVGNAMLITLASMQGVPTELYEAAKVDGANPFRRFRHITLPMISPVIFYNLIISVIGLFRYFEIPYILKKGLGDPAMSTMFLNIHLYKEAFEFQDMGYGSALAWLLFILAMGATAIIFFTARHWVYYASGDGR